MFAVVSVVASVSQIAAGSGAGAWLSAGSAVGFSAVFVLSIRHGVGGWSPVDRVVLLITMAGVVASVVANRALIAVMAVVAAEAVAIALTVRKAANDPTSETTSTWIVDLFAGVVAIAAVAHVSVVDLVYPIHHTLANAAVLGAIGLARTRRNRPDRLGGAAKLVSHI